jgi:hypothetical protein
MGLAVDADGFDAFISYSHAADGQLTPAVRLGMQAVGKKWYRLRASRIFCDQSNLSATPELWPTIEQALSASRFLVLLASPQAAASVWVQKELDWWRSNRPPSTLLIGLTDGELAWDESRQRFDPVRTTALPASVLNWFGREPLWVDLRWAREERHLSVRDPRFRDRMAGLVAPVRGVPKDTLIGEDIRQHRRSMRLLQGGATLLALFAVASLVAALVAVQRGNTALARQVAAAAVSNTTQHLDMSMLLAAEAYREEPSAQSTSALFAAVTASPKLVRFADNGTPVTALAAAQDGATVVTGGVDGRVRAWDPTGTRAPFVIAELHQPVTTVAVSDDGRSVAVGGEAGLVVLAHPTRVRPPRCGRQDRRCARRRCPVPE